MLTLRLVHFPYFLEGAGPGSLTGFHASVSLPAGLLAVLLGKSHCAGEEATCQPPLASRIVGPCVHSKSLLPSTEKNLLWLSCQGHWCRGVAPSLAPYLNPLTIEESTIVGGSWGPLDGPMWALPRCSWCAGLLVLLLPGTTLGQRRRNPRTLLVSLHEELRCTVVAVLGHVVPSRPTKMAQSSQA